MNAPHYGSNFFRIQRNWMDQSSATIVRAVREFCSPASVLDIGCGTGGMLAEFTRSGVVDVLGVEGPWVGGADVQLPRARILLHDLRIPVSLGRKFDLVVCTEVGEHLPAESAEVLVQSIVNHSDIVLFSAAVPFQGGEHHVNERWPSYWARLFRVHGYVAVDCLRRRLWNDTSVAWFYRQNLLFYVRSETLANLTNLRREYELSSSVPEPLSLIHPERFVASYTSWGEFVVSTVKALRNLTQFRRGGHTDEGPDSVE